MIWDLDLCLSISSLLFSESEKVRRRTVQEASKSTTNEWMTSPFITVKLFSCCEQVVSLETTLRPELIPGYQAWTSVPELPLSRWENLINTFQKSNSYHLFKISIRSQDSYFGARSINSQKSWSETKVIPRHKKMASRLHLLGWRRTISLGTYLMEPRGTKATNWLSFNFK